MHRVRLVVDYHVSWPVQVDRLYAPELRARLSAPLIADIEALAEQWHAEIAVGSPLEERPVAPEVIDGFRARMASVEARLARELGPAFEVE